MKLIFFTKEWKKSAFSFSLDNRYLFQNLLLSQQPFARVYYKKADHFRFCYILLKKIRFQVTCKWFVSKE